jgi:hypothetical protein
MIPTLEEKTGGTKRLEKDNGKFKTLIDQLNLVDIETHNALSPGPIAELDISKWHAILTASL